MKRTTTWVFASPVRPLPRPEPAGSRTGRERRRVSMTGRPAPRRDSGRQRDLQGTPVPGAGRPSRRSPAPFVLCLLLLTPARIWSQVDAPTAATAPASAPCRGRPGQGPEMVVIAAGRFLMGAPDNEPERSTDEGPRHGVAVQRPFALGRCEVRVGEFQVFVDDTGYRTEAERPAGQGGAARGCWSWNVAKGTVEQDPEFTWRHPGFAQGADDPVVCVTWNDARAYSAWLSLRTGESYRLPSEAEWEYAARAGTETPFWTGACIHTDQANYNGKVDYNGCGAKTGLYRARTVPVGTLPANPWGLYEVAGNVWEWVADCWHGNYQGAPVDGSAWGEAGGGDCARRVGRGGGWFYGPGGLRSAFRYGYAAGVASVYLGFRLARTL